MRVENILMLKRIRTYDQQPHEVSDNIIVKADTSSKFNNTHQCILRMSSKEGPERSKDCSSPPLRPHSCRFEMGLSVSKALMFWLAEGSSLSLSPYPLP